MSLVQHMKEMEEKNRDLTAKVAELEKSVGEKDSAIAGLSAGADKAKAEHDGILAQMGKALDDMKVAKEAAEAKAAQAAKDLEQARNALANPAFADASITGASPVNGGGDADPAPAKSLAQQLAEIKDPAKRREFFVEHFEKEGRP